MLLLYRRHNQAYAGYCAFTFHYASTLSVPYDNLEFDIYIYIPLCFYFIWRHGVYDVGCFFIYIPLCFYFIGVPTFSFSLSIHIYIPLCFYFIRYNIDRSLVISPNLHSTMLLLYRTAQTEEAIWFIQFTFHYASTLSLCHMIIWSTTSTFTFHYASTLSRRPGYRNRKIGALFTFHYASTLSLFWRISFSLRAWIYIPLCFYFIGTNALPADYPIEIYIPLCFYFISARCGNRYQNFLLFTFHYASTLSGALYAGPSIHKIYIPLCFYFITSRSKEPR